MDIQSIVSWNVNGIRAREKHNELQVVIDKYGPTIICLQEIRANEKQTLDALQKYTDTYKYIYVNPTKQKPGQFGTTVMSKVQPQEYQQDLFEQEGRLQILDFKSFVLYNMYNYFAREDLSRLDIKKQFLDDLKNDILKRGDKDVIFCGDFNVLLENKDFEFKYFENRLNSQQIKQLPGFTCQEKNAMKQLMDSTKLIDTFRHFQPTNRKYSFRAYNDHNNRQRLDFFLVNSEMIQKSIEFCDITDMYLRSDHSVIKLDFKQQRSEEEINEIGERLQLIL